MTVEILGQASARVSIRGQPRTTAEIDDAILIDAGFGIGVEDLEKVEDLEDSWERQAASALVTVATAKVPISGKPYKKIVRRRSPSLADQHLHRTGNGFTCAEHATNVKVVANLDT
ncbi:hypothetical protein [Mycobacterium tilburgii]|uniref:hypothetical protein n=1 Tax=Mycobacterium tilburgii TaxID=44467 RepID=UPI001184461E|nr:hypothetical protein [Mycobacterium tilburgii]